MRTLFSFGCLIVDEVFNGLNWLDWKLNRVRREAEEKAEYEELMRRWTDGTDHG